MLGFQLSMDSSTVVITIYLKLWMIFMGILLIWSFPGAFLVLRFFIISLTFSSVAGWINYVFFLFFKFVFYKFFKLRFSNWNEKKLFSQYDENSSAFSTLMIAIWSLVSDINLEIIIFSFSFAKCFLNSYSCFKIFCFICYYFLQRLSFWFTQLFYLIPSWSWGEWLTCNFRFFQVFNYWVSKFWGCWFG